LQASGTGGRAQGDRRAKEVHHGTPRRKPARPVRYAVIGQGYIAQVAVLPSFRHARRNSELVALFSEDPQKLAKLSRKYRVPHLYGYDDFEKGLQEAEVEALYIALPTTCTASTPSARRKRAYTSCARSPWG
jgi:hypothetical protein